MAFYIFKLFRKTNHSLGEYMLERANQTTAATFYAFVLLLPAASWLVMWLYATRGQKLVDRHLDPGYLLRMTSSTAVPSRSI